MSKSTVFARKVTVINRAGGRSFDYETFYGDGRLISRVSFANEFLVDTLLHGAAKAGYSIALPLRRYPEGELHAARYAA